MAKGESKARECLSCGKRHYGRCPEWVDRIRREPLRAAAEVAPDGVEELRRRVREMEAREADRVVEAKRAEIEAAVSGFAPAGVCPWCDARRAKNAAYQRKHRGGADEE